MFTGLVEEKGTIVSIERKPNQATITVGCELVHQDAELGASIAINGCCLTVVEIRDNLLVFEAGLETLSKTNLGDLRSESPVNLERSLAVGQRMGGHYVSGHVDGLGSVDQRNDDGEWAEFWFRVPAELTRQMAPKGSVAVDGISLTLVEVTEDRFSVALIPHTLAVTTLGARQVGDAVNIETDLLAKYVQRQLDHRTTTSGQPAPSESTTSKSTTSESTTSQIDDIQIGGPTPCPSLHSADLQSIMSTKVNKQTVSYLSRRFEEVGLNPNKRHGQNFLIDLNLLHLLARSAKIDEHDVVLEIGTGMGSLTGIFAQTAAQVITVEIDQYLFQMAAEELEPFNNIEMLKQDALKNKNQFAPEVIEAIQRHLAAGPNRVFKLAANLPYNVATPIISNLLRSEVVPATMTVTIQKELADRLVAGPGSKDYGALSVWVQSICDTEIVRVMSPKVFWPRPKVDSAIIHIVHRPERRSNIQDLDFFYAFVRAMFFHRRKFMRSVIVSAFKNQLSKPDVDDVLQRLEYGPDCRTEQLDIPQIQKLAEAFRQKVIEVTGVERPIMANQGS